MTDFAGLSAEDLSDVIGAIYDCTLEPERWRGTIRKICDLCDSPIATLGIQDMRNAQYSRVYDDGYDPKFLELYPQHAHQNPIFPSAFLKDVGQVNTQAMLCGEEFYETLFYREFLTQFGYHDTIGFMALRSGERMAFLSASRTVDEPRYGEREIGLLTLLSPHVCRALKISDALDLRTLNSEMLEATLDQLSAGVYLTDTQGRVVHRNAAAENQLRRAHALRIEQGRLVPTHAEARAALATALSGLSTATGVAAPGGITIALPGKDDAGLVATVIAIDRGQRRAVFAPFAATTAIFVQDPTVAPLMPGEAFAKLYGLTGGELRVLLAIAPGLSLKEAAEMLGIGEATAKTHLQHIFAKTGTSKQTELLHLLMSSAPPVTAG